MPIRRSALLVVAFLLLPASVCRAGLHSPSDQHSEELHPDYRIFRNTYLKYKNVLNEALPSILRPKALMVLDLYPVLKANDLAEYQVLDASASLVRLKKYPEAIDILDNAKLRFPDSFLLKANSATTRFLRSGEADIAKLGGNESDDLDHAKRELEDVLDSWPRKWTDIEPSQQKYFEEKLGWKKFIGEQWPDELKNLPEFKNLDYFKFYRQTELLLLKLIIGRRNEVRNVQKNAASKAETEKKRTVDNLFVVAGQEPLRFVGPSGEFEPGKLADTERNKLPDKSLKKAIVYVEQLLIWLPLDERLYWQLAELLNADGDIDGALEIFNSLTATKEQPYEELNAHRKALQDFKAKKNAEGNGSPVSPTKPPDSTGVENWGDPWRFFAVGLGAGAVAALFVYWQIRRFFRPRPRGAAA